MSQNKPLTYKDAGVDIEKGNKAVDRIKPLVEMTKRPEVLGGLGGFAGLFELDIEKYKKPVLISGTDGVGTKLRLAFLCDRHNTVGIDAVAMCVNDILVIGAEPLYFLDYIAVGKLDPDQVADVVAGISEGCRQAGCALIGGETAEMPGFYKDNEYDIAGFSVGIVEKNQMIDGSNIEIDDILIGLPSTGLHSNGYSLVRKIVFEKMNLYPEDIIPGFKENVGELLLKPTRIYVQDILPLLEKNREAIKGMAHITGGGLLENIPRVIPQGLHVEIIKGSWPILPIFDWLQEQGDVPNEDMYRTFNMGIGFVLIIKKEDVELIKEHFNNEQIEYYEIGKVVDGSGGVVIK